MNNKRVLNDIMLKYIETRDGDLITEEVYEQLIKLARYTCRSFMMNYSLYRNTDELMSAINVYLWDKIYDYDPDRSSVATYISLLMYTAVLIDIRRNRKNDNICVSFEEYIVQDESIKMEDILNDNKSLLYIDIMIINESSKPIIKEVIDNIKFNHRRSKIYEKLDEILQLTQLGLTQTDIANYYNISRSMVSKIITATRKEIYDRLKLEGII